MQSKYIIDRWFKEWCYEGTLVTGATGSGKTSSSGVHLAEVMLRNGWGGLVLCVKPEEYQFWLELATRTGRNKDLVRFSVNSGHGFNFLDYESNPTYAGGGCGIVGQILHTFSQVLAIVGRSGSRNKDNPFWDQARDQLLRNAFQLCISSGEKLTAELLYSVLMAGVNGDDQVLDGLFYKAMEKHRQSAAIVSDLNIAVDYLKKELPNLDERTRSNIQITVTSFCDILMRHPLKELFAGATTVSPADIFQGKIVVVDISVKQFGTIGAAANGIWKFCFQTAAERRKDKSVPCFLWMDEGQYFLTDYDALFQQTARSSRVATVLLTQNIPNMIKVLGKDSTDSLLGNYQTHIFHQNQCPITNQWMEDTLPVGENRGSTLRLVLMDLKTGGEHNHCEVEALWSHKGMTLGTERWVKVTLKQKKQIQLPAADSENRQVYLITTPNSIAFADIHSNPIMQEQHLAIPEANVIYIQRSSATARIWQACGGQPRELEHALNQVRQRIKGGDIVVIARGGGDTKHESFRVYNSPASVSAILTLQKEHGAIIITAIGHAKDHWLIDDYADIQADVPANVGNYLAREVKCTSLSQTESTPRPNRLLSKFVKTSQDEVPVIESQEPQEVLEPEFRQCKAGELFQGEPDSVSVDKVIHFLAAQAKKAIACQETMMTHAEVFGLHGKRSLNHVKICPSPQLREAVRGLTSTATVLNQALQTCLQANGIDKEYIKLVGVPDWAKNRTDLVHIDSYIYRFTQETIDRQIAVIRDLGELKTLLEQNRTLKAVIDPADQLNLQKLARKGQSDEELFLEFYCQLNEMPEIQNVGFSDDNLARHKEDILVFKTIKQLLETEPEAMLRVLTQKPNQKPTGRILAGSIPVSLPEVISGAPQELNPDTTKV